MTNIKNLHSQPMKSIVEVKGLWKQYNRGAQEERYLNLRDSLYNWFRKNNRKELFWALQDINFEVHPGDSLAIIGRNGAGKSTLLKILSKITPPSKGEIVLRGRLASLLEVGTGFHPELTGRENIFLNGSILGLTRHEIQRQFDAIVDFSGVESFLETPLKHYSSGMQLRLAFSVAAHLEPEILVIDEVLAVGDHLFQKKCIAKMTDISKSGRTLIFVSHNKQAIQKLCQKAILLEEGKLIAEGETHSVLSIYTSEKGPSLDNRLITSSRKGNGDIQFMSLTQRTIFNDRTNSSKLVFEILIRDLKNMGAKNIDFGMAIYNNDDIQLVHISNRFKDIDLTFGENEMMIYLEVDNVFRPGVYSTTLFLRSNEVIEDWLTDCFRFHIDDWNPYNYEDTAGIQGKIFPNFDMKLQNPAQ